MANKKRIKDSGNNGDDDDADDDDDDDDMNPNIKINIENILNNDFITSEYLEELSKNFFKQANAMRTQDNEDDSEDNGNNGNNGHNHQYDKIKEVVDESKEFLETIKKMIKIKNHPQMIQ